MVAINLLNVVATMGWLASHACHTLRKNGAHKAGDCSQGEPRSMQASSLVSIWIPEELLGSMWATWVQSVTKTTFTS